MSLCKHCKHPSHRGRQCGVDVEPFWICKCGKEAVEPAPPLPPSPLADTGAAWTEAHQQRRGFTNLPCVAHVPSGIRTLSGGLICDLCGLTYAVPDTATMLARVADLRRWVQMERNGIAANDRPEYLRFGDGVLAHVLTILDGDAPPLPPPPVSAESIDVDYARVIAVLLPLKIIAEADEPPNSAADDAYNAAIEDAVCAIQGMATQEAAEPPPPIPIKNNVDWPEPDRGRQVELEKRRPLASPHIKAALRGLDEAMEAFGGWWPEDLECAMVVARLMDAATLIEPILSSARERMLRQCNERLLAAIERMDEKAHATDLAERQQREPETPAPSAKVQA